MACQHILAFWNEFQNSCKWLLKYLHLMYARNEHFTTHLVPEAHKYEQNKTGNTDTDYEYINTTIIILFCITSVFSCRLLWLNSGMWTDVWLVSPVYLVVDKFSSCVIWPLTIGLMVVLLTFFFTWCVCFYLKEVDAILGNGYGI